MTYPKFAALALAVCLTAGIAATPAFAGKHQWGQEGDMMAHKGGIVENGFQDAQRTINRLPSGDIFTPERFYEKPEHYGFTPSVSNWEPHHDHPKQWEGQDWDPSMWNKDWTQESTLKGFFHARILERQYMRKGKPPLPVLELGPKFYKLSDLDQRRILKLIADYTNVFGEGFPMIQLNDWHTQKIVGTYTPKGMFLN